MHAAISEEKVLSAALSFVTLGLREAGYEYVNIDVCPHPLPSTYSILTHLRTAGLYAIATAIQTNKSLTHQGFPMELKL